jgi:hypothetical protein
MSLSERIRPNCEAAPWVVEEVKRMEDRITQLEQAGDEVARVANGIGTTATDDGSFIVRSLRAVAAWTKLRNP